MIEGVKTKKLNVHCDERGSLFEILRSDEELFQKFGQTYITKCLPGWVKGWHYHKMQTDHFCVIRGNARIVLYDRRDTSKTKGEVQEFELNGEEPTILVIPIGVVHGFENCGNEEVWILNIPTETYNRESPDEFRIPLNDTSIPYEKWWNRKGW